MHARARKHARTHARTRAGLRNDPVNSSPSRPATLHSSVATRGAFIYLRNTSRDSIWYMCMLAPLVARLFVHFIRHSFRPVPPPRSSLSCPLYPLFFFLLIIPVASRAMVIMEYLSRVGGALCFYFSSAIYYDRTVK